MFPDLPYPGYSWRVTHHMGMVTPRHLYHLLWAANQFGRNRDQAVDINNYLISNELWTPNIREDSGQPEGWRDYQQALSELALIYSVRVLPQITLTPIGLQYLDGSLSFSEIMTLQALRFQYPNGQHTQLSPQQKAAIAATPYANVSSFLELQSISGVKIRPAVFVWRVLQSLEQRGGAGEISQDEIERYLMRCSTNSDAQACANAITAARRGGLQYARLGERERRNAADWIKFLDKTLIFAVTAQDDAVLTRSGYGIQHAAEIDQICGILEAPATFWQAAIYSKEERLQWFAHFGGVDLTIPGLPLDEAQQTVADFAFGEEKEDERGSFGAGITGGEIRLREFRDSLITASNSANATISSVYSAELANSSRRLHDRMVSLIAHTCKAKGAKVYYDPASVDLLVQHRKREFIIEVKSVTPRNFVSRLRYALGQVLHYDYKRASMSTLPRRRVLALAAQIPDDSWSVDFLNGYMDTDLLTLDLGNLRLHSGNPASAQLFN